MLIQCATAGWHIALAASAASAASAALAASAGCAAAACLLLPEGAHLLGLLDPLIPCFVRFAHFVLRHEEPVVGAHQQLVTALELRVVLCCALDQSVLHAFDGDVLGKFLTHLIHIVDRDSLRPHAEHECSRLHSSFALLNQSRLLGDRRR